MKRSVPFAAALTLILLCLSHAAIRADDVPEFALTPVGSCMHSEIGASAIRGDYAYSVTPHGLLVIDISDPANPSLVSETFIRNRTYISGSDMLPYISLKGNIAYIAGLNVLTAVDISNPHAPYIVDTATNADDWLNWVDDMEISGDRIYLCNDSGLAVFDISNPANIALIGQYHQYKSNGLAVTDSLVFVITSYDGLIVLDASDPSAIYELTRYDLDGARVEIVDTLAFAIAGGLVILNIADPMNVTEVSRSSSGGMQGPVAFEVKNDLACVNSPYIGTHVIDISNPESPVLTSSINEYYGGMDIDLRDTLAVLSGWVWGLTILNVADPTEPEFVGQYRAAYFGDRMAIKGDYAYSLASGRLQAVNLSRPQDPYLAGQCPMSTLHSDLVICDTLIYISAVNGLYVANISDPESPVVVDSFVTDTSWWGRVTADEHYVYWAGPGLRILDKSGLSPISVVGYLPINSRGDIAVSSGYAYMFGLSELIEIDISDPTAPQPVDYQETFYPIHWDEVSTIVIRWPYLYAVGISATVRPTFVVFDIEDPYNPILDTTIYYTGYDVVASSDMVIAGDSAYLLGGHFLGMHIFDLSNPGKPQFVAESDISGSDLEIVGNTFYFGSREGFFIATTSAVTCGDINGDGPINTGDIVWLINYIFKGGPALVQNGDVDGSGGINIADVVYMVNYLFGDGPPPNCP